MPLTSFRHGSSSADSWKSDDTVKAFDGGGRSTPVQINTESRARFDNDGEVSPGSRPSSSQRFEIAPWEDVPDDQAPRSNPVDIPMPRAIMGSPPTSRSIPNARSIHNLASSSNSRSRAASDARDASLRPASHASHAPFSKPSRAGTPQQALKPGEPRRTSIASASSNVSNDSLKSKAFQKKLHGIFGEDGQSSKPHQSTVSGGTTPKETHGSTEPTSYFSLGSNLASAQASPGPSRPRSPQPPKEPSSEVTPWLFQDPNDVKYGEAPVRQDIQDHSRSVPQPKPAEKSGSSLRPHIRRHRRETSADQTSVPADVATANPASVPPSARTETFPFLRNHNHASPFGSTSRLGSKTSLSNMRQQDGSAESHAENSIKSQDGTQTKRSLLDRIRGRNKDKNAAFPDTLRNLGASSNTSLPPTSPKETPTMNLSPPTRQAVTPDASTTAQNGKQSTVVVPGSARREHHHHRLPFNKHKRPTTADQVPIAKDPNQANANQNHNDALWTLDTDLTQMEGIVGNPAIRPQTSRNSTSRRGGSTDDAFENLADEAPGTWDAPDSWAVNRIGADYASRLHERDHIASIFTDEDLNTQFCIRIFKPDGSFTTLALPIASTAAEIIHTMGKKASVSDELNSFHIILRKHDVSRQLDPGEHPVAIQKRLLEQAGYNESDKLADLGREDFSYLCRFNFLPSSMIGYSSLEKDPYFNKMQKFSNLDLSGRNLITIPIVLYSKSSEIVFLNLSRNLSLDVPKDFIQGCTSLREIRFTGNEAWRLPSSFSLASRLTVLDVSNNRLDTLDPAELHKLINLASLKLANNKLTQVPKDFSLFRSLRSLNLSSNFLVDLPLAVCEIKTLVDLDISFNSIKSLPHIGRLTNLERLWCTNNLLSGRREDTIANLQNLREVDIRFNSTDNIDALSRLPNLETLLAGHNSITSFEGSFSKIRTLYLDHNPITNFGFVAPVTTLTTLSLASCKLAQLPDELFMKLSGLQKLMLNKNHMAALTPGIGFLTSLQHLGVARNALTTIPTEIGRLTELRFFDVRENNISELPPQIWFCRNLETLNVSSNVLDSFPKPPSQAAIAGYELGPPPPASVNGGSLNGGFDTPETEDGDKLGEYNPVRRGSQTSGWLSTSSSPSGRKNSVASMYGQSLGSRKPSMLSRAATDVSMVTRKDSMAQTRAAATMAGSLRQLLVADNRLQDEVFEHLATLYELRVLNLSYNEIYEIPHRVLRRLPWLAELYLSGNELTSLPTDDLEEAQNLKVLYVNNNKFMVLPGELSKARKLAVLDAGSNSLKYNVTNWPYDWNWNANPNLKYLNLSGNKRLEIKPAPNYVTVREEMNLTDFSSLPNLRILGLMDVTIMIQSVPEQSDDRRIRTAGSVIGSMTYGVADCLGRNEHLSTMDFVANRHGNDEEAIIGLFDGVQVQNGGAKVAKFLQENFRAQFEEEMQRRGNGETAEDALRRSFLALNKELATWTLSIEAKERRKEMVVGRETAVNPQLTNDDLNSGCVATVMYLHGMDLYVANVGDAEAVLIQSEGGFRPLTRKHDPAEAQERQRIRNAGGYVSRQGKLNDVLDVSRAFGFVNLTPVVIAAPYTTKVTLQESDEIILIASREMWDYLTPGFAVDLARSERNDLMRAAEKLRDMAIAFGASTKITVMLIGVSDLRKRERARYRTHSMSMGPLGSPSDDFVATRRGRRGRDATLDSKLNRLDSEVDPPTGEISLVFTDIKNSTLLWETYPTAMRSAIRMHNELMRRQLRLIGGYEVKTEGDAFMVAFPTVSSALLWCFTVQSQLLDLEWPQEILTSPHCQTVTDDEGNALFKGLSVRMGAHWGRPVCETDPVTRRMDYFGPIVNRAARISAVADGGQITVSSDFISEIQKLLETHFESDRAGSGGSEEQMNDEVSNSNIHKELRSLSSHGFEVVDLGERRLKGLENPEYIYMMYPHSLWGRDAIRRQQAETEKTRRETASLDSHLTIDLNSVWDMWNISLRLEMLCSSLENPNGMAELKPPETALLDRTKDQGEEITDRFLFHFVEHQISRIETCVTTLALRNMVRPFKDGMLNNSCPMSDILTHLTAQLAELASLKQQIDIDMAPS